MQSIHIVTLSIFNSNNELLLVKKKGSQYFQLPGGKRNLKEDDFTVIQRELMEELQLDTSKWEIGLLGVHESIAVNEKNTKVEGRMYCTKTRDTIQPIVDNEIESFIWINSDNYKSIQWANLVSEFIFPLWSMPVVTKL